ncbi:MAG TPA: hypothetical protein VND43_07550 [Burkholderiales bacterium]|nr:hypothetical protein [Burkholderiales bacterium]
MRAYKNEFFTATFFAAAWFLGIVTMISLQLPTYLAHIASAYQGLGYF